MKLLLFIGACFTVFLFACGQKAATVDKPPKCQPVDCNCPSTQCNYPAATLETILQRKSVRRYKPGPISQELLTKIVRAGFAAPSAGDKRPWYFVAIDDRQVLDALATGLPHGKMLKKAGAAIVVAGDPSRFLAGKKAQYWIQDCSAATQNILLAVEALKLGAVWIGVYPNEKRVKWVQKALGLPETVIPLNVISIGFPSGVEKPKEKFDPKRLRWNKWGQ